MRRASLSIVLVAAGCARHPAPAAPIGFPAACQVHGPGAGQAPWHWSMGVDCLAARAADGGAVRLDWAGHMLHRTNPDGSERWAVDYRDAHGQVCGAPEGLAIARDGAVALTCGYSLLAFDPDGRRRWQIWPAGDTAIGGPLVDDAGVIYVAAGGALRAIGPDGKQRWAAGYGGDRSASQIGVLAGGGFALDTTVDVWFGDDDTVYHPDPDPQLVVIGADGRVVEQRARRDGEPWPAWIPVVGEGGGRVPPAR